jgi:hypothetical protein
MRAVLAALVVVLAAGCASSASKPHETTTVAAAKPPTKTYLAALAYAKCMRAKGLPFPLPDARGDFHLSYRRERALEQAATAKERNAADAACFHHLKGTVDTKPLSKQAQQQALQPLYALKACLESHGYEVGTPIVRLMSRGRAMFGFTRTNGRIPTDVQHGCEREVKLSKKLDAIIRRDRSP